MKLVGRLIKYFLFPVLLLAIGGITGSVLLINKQKQLSADANWFETKNGIDQSGFIEIGGIQQYVRIRGRDLNNPVLLDLHGGPGGATSAITHRTLRPLTEYFTLVEWDQRGAGRTTNDKLDLSSMTYETMVEDTAALIKHLQTTLEVEKVILVGHSWGSMLGLGVARKHPDLLYAYVGVGQALSWLGGFDETQRLLIAAAKDADDQETLENLQNLSPEWPPKENINGIIKRITTIQKPLVKYGTSIHASKRKHLLTSNFVLDILVSPEIGILETPKMLNSSKATLELMIDLYERDLRTDLGKDFEIPIFIFQGEHDWQTATTLVKPWFAQLRAPHKTYIPFEDSAHIVINEEPGKYLLELVTKVRPYALPLPGGTSFNTTTRYE